MAEKEQVLHTADPSAAWEPLFQALGLPLYRVHAEDRIALIQAPQEDYERLLQPEVRAALFQHGKSLGYLFVTLDMTYCA
jgi:PP-loop superfamily ATP-utilizing enzyme